MGNDFSDACSCNLNPSTTKNEYQTVYKFIIQNKFDQNPNYKNSKKDNNTSIYNETYEVFKN